MKVCVGCVYCNECGNTNREMSCDGRQTKSQQEKVARNLLADLKGTFADRDKSMNRFVTVTEMIEKGFTTESIDLMKKYNLIQSCAYIDGEKYYTW